jgi:hypothetical protein
MKKERITSFVGAPTNWQQNLIKEGYSIYNIRRFLIHNLCNLAETLKNRNIINEKISVCIYEDKPDCITKILIEYLQKYVKNLSIISSCFEEYSSLSERLFKKYGTALIISNEVSLTENANIIFALNDCEELLKNINDREKNKLIITTDNFVPTAFLPFKIINAYCPQIPTELLEIKPDYISLCEYSAALEYEDILKNKPIEKTFSFGREEIIK